MCCLDHFAVGGCTSATGVTNQMGNRECDSGELQGITVSLIFWKWDPVKSDQKQHNSGFTNYDIKNVKKLQWLLTGEESVFTQWNYFRRVCGPFSVYPYAPGLFGRVYEFSILIEINADCVSVVVYIQILHANMECYLFISVK